MPGNKTPDQMIADIYVVLLGIPGTDEKGVVGEIKDINKHLRELNGTVANNTKRYSECSSSVKWIRLIICGIVLVLIGIISSLVVMNG